MLRTGLTLAVGAAGGAVFAYLGLPLAWMLGAMVATTLFAMGGAPMAVDMRLRALMVTVLGIMLGSAFHPEILSRVGEWLAGFSLLVLYIPLTTAIVFLWFRRIGGFDRSSAFFSASPGGLTEMVLVGEAMGGDSRLISLVHATRILVVVFAVPFFFRYFEQIEMPAVAPGRAASALPWSDGLLLAACGLLGWLFGRFARIPAAQLIGPMLFSAIVHIAGWTQSRPPPEAVAIAQLVVGAAIGSRFAGLALRRVFRTLLLALGSATIMLLMTTIVTLSLGSLIGMNQSAVALSLAPGGLTEMSLVALALGVDTAYVAVMHILRIALVVVAVPAVWRLISRNGAG